MLLVVVSSEVSIGLRRHQAVADKRSRGAMRNGESVGIVDAVGIPAIVNMHVVELEDDTDFAATVNLHVLRNVSIGNEVIEVESYLVADSIGSTCSVLVFNSGVEAANDLTFVCR